MKKNKTSIPIAVVLLSLPLVLLPDPSSADGTEDLVVPKGSVLGVVDGSKGGGEYLTTKNLSNGLGSFDVQTYRSADGSIEEIQLFFSINDSSQQSGDEIRIYFDADHDHSPDLSIDRGIKVKRQPAAVKPGYHHFRNTTLDYEIAYYLVNEPSPTGTWQTISTATLSAEVGDNTFALFDPTVYAFFSAVESGDAFTLKAVLKENGQPITGPGATVVVDVSKPEEGLGTYASTAQRDCTFTPPVFDPAPASAQPATATGQGEALPPLFAKVRELLGFCDKEGLERSHLSGLPLYDDGTHGDELAGDGIHTLRFEDTWREGTYTFAFEASGSAPSGSSFSRQRTLSIHRSVDVVAETTELNFVELPRPGGGRLLVYYIIPRGSEGQYLGPGHVDQIDFLTADGDWLTAMIDHQNGVYSRMLGLEAGQRRPVVTAVAQGKPLGEVGRFQGIPDELVLPFAGGFFFDDSLGIDDDVVFGAKLGYHLTPRVTLELEGGITSTETEAGTSVDLLQALANFRFHFRRWDGGRSDPYLTGGTGIVFFRSALGNDDAIAIQGGVGTIYHFSNSLGLQLEARVLRLEGLLDVEATTNYQATAGLVFTLK